MLLEEENMRTSLKHFSTTTYKLEDAETVVKVSGGKKQNLLNFIISKQLSFKTLQRVAKAAQCHCTSCNFHQWHDLSVSICQEFVMSVTTNEVYISTSREQRNIAQHCNTFTLANEPTRLPTLNSTFSSWI